MNTFQVVCLLNTFLFSTVGKDSTCETNGIEILYNHRFYLSDMYHPCKDGVGLRLRDCKDVSILLDTFENKNIKSWETNSDILWEDFFTLCRLNGRAVMGKLPGVLPNDTILTEILAKALSYKGSLKVQQDAFGVLNDATPYKLITKYSKQIMNSLCSSEISQTAKEILLSYCDLTPELQKEILEDTTLPVTARIRLGDKKAEKDLFTKFNSETDFKKRAKVVEQLAHAGTPECLKFLIEKFNDPIYLYGKGDCIIASIKFTIIKGFQRHLPEDTLYNKTYLDMRGYGDYNIEVRDSILLDYAKSIIKSFKKNYNVSPTHNLVNPVFKGPHGCSNQQF